MSKAMRRYTVELEGRIGEKRLRRLVEGARLRLVAYERHPVVSEPEPPMLQHLPVPEWVSLYNGVAPYVVRLGSRPPFLVANYSTRFAQEMRAVPLTIECLADTAGGGAVTVRVWKR